MPEPPPFDVAVLGAGAAGLMAAIRAAERGRRVILLEKNRRPGVKILMSGGTRCNITNARGLHTFSAVSGPIDPAFDQRESRGHASIIAAFGKNGSFLRPALKAFSVDATIQFFEAEGVATKIEGNGKIFPVSDRAVDVLAALVARLERTGADLRTNTAVRSITPCPDGGFELTTDDAPLHATRVIIAVGGRSYPGSGTTGDGYEFARAFGHTIVNTVPALVPLRVDAPWVAGLKGITLPDVFARIVDASGRSLVERREAVLFAHFGLTGPAILDISRAVATGQGPHRIELDLVPDQSREQLDSELATAARAGRSTVANLLPQSLPRRFAEVLVNLAQIPQDRIGPELSRDERKRLVNALKQLSLPVTGDLGFAKAEVTSGGVALEEVDPATLESKRQPGLHFCGEVLDLDGLIGGFNFQSAWSTGWLAGSAV